MPAQHDESGGSEALKRLRTVEFRQTLRGYHIDDVDAYLEQVAVEVEALVARADTTGSRKDDFRRTPETAATGVSQPTMRPSTGWAVVTCMDTRVDLEQILGVHPGDAHVIRNAGGVVTDDTIRSLAISQRLGGTHSVVVVHHTDCALLTITDEGFVRQVSSEAGVAPPWTVGAFTDPEEDVRRSMGRIADSPFLPDRDKIRGFVYDVWTQRLHEVDRLAGRGTEPSQRPMWSSWW